MFLFNRKASFWKAEIVDLMIKRETNLFVTMQLDLPNQAASVERISFI